MALTPSAGCEPVGESAFRGGADLPHKTSGAGPVALTTTGPFTAFCAPSCGTERLSPPTRVNGHGDASGASVTRSIESAAARRPESVRLPARRRPTFRYWSTISSLDQSPVTSLISAEL